MKPLLISLILCTFLISCAAKYPQGYSSEKQYHDMFTGRSCESLRLTEIKDQAQIYNVKRSKRRRKELIAHTLAAIIIIPFMLAPVPGDRPNIDLTTDTGAKIDSLEIELRMINIVAKEKNCPKEINYEIITDKSHNSHLPH